MNYNKTGTLLLKHVLEDPRMKMPALATAAALLTTALSACAPTAQMPVGPISNPAANLNAQSAAGNNTLANRVLIGYTGSLSAQKIQQLERQNGLRFVRDIKAIGVAVFQSSGALSAASLPRDPSFKFVGNDQSPRRIVAQPQEVPAPRTRSGDPLMAQQWSLKAVEAESAWQITTGTNVKVAVVDTGVDLQHPDLKANIIEGYNAEQPGTPAQDGHYHGTHVAGIIAAVANNGEGVTGIAPTAKIMPVRAISNGGVAEVADGIVWAADNGARVINLSLGWDYPNASVEETIKRAVKYALDKNVVVCAALSNASSYNPRSTPDNLANKPGFEGVVGVGNVDTNDRRGGAPGEWKSVSSPGTQIMSTLPNGKYGNLTGTSMATPMVAGIAALMIAQNPTLTNRAIKERMMATAIDIGAPGFDNEFGAGRINAARVLASARIR
jgi:subtilisin family serine protease